MGPVILSQARVSFSFLLLLPLLLLFGGREAVSFPRREALRSMLLGVLGLAGANYFYYLAIDKSTVATAIIVQYTAPVWVLCGQIHMFTLRAILATRAARVKPPL